MERTSTKPTRGRHLVRTLLAGLCVAGGLGATGVALASGASNHAITTNVTTTVPNFEFNAYFGETLAQISCELDVHLTSPGTKPLSEAYCMSYTSKLVHHVTLSPSGVVKTCVGANCGSNAGDGTPDFSPFTRVRSGPFTCVVLTRSVRCTVASGKGFVISTSAITKLPAA